MKGSSKWGPGLEITYCKIVELTYVFEKTSQDIYLDRRRAWTHTHG